MYENVHVSNSKELLRKARDSETQVEFKSCLIDTLIIKKINWNGFSATAIFTFPLAIESRTSATTCELQVRRKKADHPLFSRENRILGMLVCTS